jgi:peptidoglycan/xylan/chitin deacetylase (PgdA/CDA1 family)
VRSARAGLLLALGLLAGCGGARAAHRPAPGARPGRHQRPSPATAAIRLGPRPRRGAAARRAAVPILMYHVINAPPPGAPYPELWTPPTTFAGQMAALRRAGYRAVTLDRVLAAWDHGAPLPRRPLVVSFDDGYLSQATKAGPVLRRLGWPGVLDLEVHDLGDQGIPVPAVRGLIDRGWEVASHTVDHPDLTMVDPARLRYELVASRQAIRRRFGVPVDAFCYPAGRFDAAVQAAVRAAGYRAATTERPGWATPGDDRLALPRIRVDGTESPAALVAAVAAGRR